MQKKKLNSFSGLVYSTNPDFKMDHENIEEQETPEPRQQKLRIRLSTKQRAGKTVTLIEGFIGKAADLESVEKKLKNFCGTGGSSKDGEIIIQGDNRDKVLDWLLKNGYSGSKKS